MAVRFQFNDGGRAAAGFKGNTGDCVTRAIAIAVGKPYAQVYSDMADGLAHERMDRVGEHVFNKRSPRSGVRTDRAWFKRYMEQLGWSWVACMGIGTGCRVHLKSEELPAGRIIVSLSHHYAAVIDGVLNDLYDCSRNETRCVYGYWKEGDL